MLNFTSDAEAWATIRATFLAKGYAFFEGHLNLNLVGIRMPSALPDRFDDYLICTYEVGEHKRFHLWPCTTDPGQAYRDSPLNPNGTAVMEPQQVRRSYRAGKHRGRPALVQRGTHPKYRRVTSEGTWGPVRSESIGLNIHDAGRDVNVDSKVGKASAGCQVLAYRSDMRMLLHLVEEANQAGQGEWLSYTLLRFEDLVKNTALG